MHRQLVKSILVVLLSLSRLASFGQFTNDAKLWYDLRGKPKSCLTFSYNRITRGDSAGKLKLNSYTKVLFNTQGQLVERYYAGTVNHGNINDEYKHTYKYDSKGNITEMVNYAPDGNAESKFEFTYSGAKGLYLLKRYDLRGIDTPRILYGFKVDTAGRIKEQYNYDEHGHYHLIVNKYNANALRIETTETDSNGEVRSKKIVKYNRYNDMAESFDPVSWFPTRNTLLNFDYPKYDKFNNWLIRDMAINGKPHSVEKRKITYYK